MNKKRIIVFFGFLFMACALSILMTPDKIEAKGKISLEKKSVSIGITGETELKLKGLGKKQLEIVKWTSSDKKVASVSKLSGNGYVMANSIGKAVITARYKKKSYTCNVTVTQGTSGWPYMLDPYFSKPGVHNLEWQYEDSLFNDPASTYQKKLTLDSILLSMASDPDSKVDVKEQSHKVKELLSVFGFDHYSANADYQEKPREDTLGVGFACKKITSKEKEFTLIAVVVRSSGYGNEWLSNMKIGSEGDHQGFTESSDKLIRDLNTYIQDQQITGPVKLWLSGHSRGATACNLAAAKIADHPELLSGISSEREDIYCYGISTVKAACRASMTKNPVDDYSFIHNTYLPQDFFIQFAPDKYSFTRYGVDHEITYDETMKNKSLAALKKWPASTSLYEKYKENDPDTYHAKEMGTRILDTLTYVFPTRNAYMEELYPILKGIVGGSSIDLTAMLDLLNSEIGKKILRGYYESKGEPVPEDLFKKTTSDDGTTKETVNIFGNSVVKLIKEFGHYYAMFIQHYIEVVYMFYANSVI